MHLIPGPRYMAVGYDGSPNSIAELRRAAADAQRHPAGLDVIKVIPCQGGLRRAPSAWLGLRKEEHDGRGRCARDRPGRPAADRLHGSAGPHAYVRTRGGRA